MTIVSSGPSSATAFDGEALVDACLAGVPGAWRRLVDRYEPLVRSVARRVLRRRAIEPSAEDLDDICENTFCALVARDARLLRRYDRRHALTTWIGVVARSEALKAFRRRRPPRAALDPATLATPHAGPLQQLSDADHRRAVRRALAALGPRDRAVLEQFYFDGGDYRAIAQRLGMSANSVGALLHRARRRLERELRRRGLN